MAGYRTIALLAMIMAFLPLASILEADASVQDVQSTITIPPETSIVLRGNETTEIHVDGFFTITEVGPFDTVGGLTATLSISEGTWGPTLSQTLWNNVERNHDYAFSVDLTIPGGTQAGDSGSYTLYLNFANPIDSDVGSNTQGFVVQIESVIDTGDTDDDDDDSGIISPTEDESFPLWPIFIVVIVIGLLIAGIWVRKNIEFVREEDGSRRIMMREKDTGHILGRKKQPPPELDL